MVWQEVRASTGNYSRWADDDETLEAFPSFGTVSLSAPARSSCQGLLERIVEHGSPIERLRALLVPKPMEEDLIWENRWENHFV